MLNPSLMLFSKFFLVALLYETLHRALEAQKEYALNVLQMKGDSWGVSAEVAEDGGIWK